MMNLKIHALVIAILAIGAAPRTLRADIVIDNFSPTPSVTAFQSSVGSTSANYSSGSVLGGTAKYTLDFTSIYAPPPETQTARMVVSSGYFSLGTDAGANAQILASYSGAGFDGGGTGLDMTIPNFDGIKFAYIVADLGFTATVHIYDTLGNIVSTATKWFDPITSTTPPTEAYIPKSAFSNTSVFGSAIGAIEFIFDPPANGDLTLKGPLVMVTAAPEPSSIALAISALIPGAVLLRARRGRKAKAS